MQAGTQGVGPTPGRGRLGALLVAAAVVVIVTLMVWVVPLETSGIGTEDAIPKAGSSSAVVHDDAGNMPSVAGSAVIHDDAGSLNPR
jgi:hypothetical protein